MIKEMLKEYLFKFALNKYIKKKKKHSYKFINSMICDQIFLICFIQINIYNIFKTFIIKVLNYQKIFRNLKN